MIWVGNADPPPYFRENLNIWKTLMPHWTYMIWTNDKINDNWIDSNYLKILKNAIHGSQMADMLKWYVLHKWGGHYLDSDVTPIKSLDNLNLDGYEVVLCHDLPITWNYIACGYVASKPNHTLFRNLVTKMYSVDINDPALHLTTGPGALGSEWSNINWTKDNNYLMLPYWFFYRNRIGDPDVNMPNRIMRDHPDAIGNHFYAGSWL